MPITVVMKFTASDMDSIGELRRQVLKGAAYLNENTEASVTVLSPLSGDSDSVLAVEAWPSLAIFEAEFQILDEDPKWQALGHELRQVVSNIRRDFYRRLGP